MKRNPSAIERAVDDAIREQMRELGKKRWSNLTPEQARAARLKQWDTRRKNLAEMLAKEAR
jgi:hypothetical protein